ncbi:LLM class flavin-dependent oxidoreductase [Segniliparus rugosus]|uniref:Luciferase family oxidoreductase, group 1 n=1 Tax=Segniliparus rugosus (strain ATCC BAA-974 / DSM 45345 / CCUG 50838 / CIP 108380 / JCM 13579 / CDC 945) TaxID=679197 RepID=E5XSE8_SEGRC|nr:LLM class flavin-dependent oxidoreductase [Segniliparus rugosus]EFV12729.1 luciferase family oxidoreductase, group 1 [Segniliparus rugosus ATCC BAA-974]
MTKLSVLDLSTVGEGQSTAEAVAATTRLAQLADRLGYHRFWVAEHHNMPMVAATSPPVLIAHLGSATERIRLGSGGVMLPNHAPLVVAEQFALLEALHPGRIDLGIGRAPGTDRRTSAALRGGRSDEAVANFPHDVVQTMALLGDGRVRPEVAEGLTATPSASSAPEVVLLGSSGYSAHLAGTLGLPFAFAHHFAPEHTKLGVATYQESFRPTERHPEPYLIIGASAFAAEDEAERLSLPGLLATLGIRTNRLRPTPSVASALADPDRHWVDEVRKGRIIGARDRVIGELKELAAATGADELMITTITHGYAERARSFELIAQGWGLSGQ